MAVSVFDYGNLTRGSDLSWTFNALRLLEAAFAEAPQGVIVLTTDGTILSANRSAHTMFAYAPGELPGQSVKRLMPEPMGGWHADFSRNSWLSSHGGSIGSGETVAGLRKDGVPVPLEVSFNVVDAASSRFVMASIVDVTERLSLEWQLSSATHQHLGFQQLIADIAARFATVKPADVDEAIAKNLREVTEALDLDRGILWRHNTGETVGVATHYWISANQPSPPPPYEVASIPWVFSRLTAGQACWFTKPDELPDPVDRETFLRQGPRSAAVFPLAGNSDDVLRSLSFGSMTREQEWVPAIVERLRLVAGVISQALARKTSQAALDRALDELQELRTHATDHVERRRPVKTQKTSQLIVSDSAAIRHALAQIEQVAPTPATVLLLGETGTGKEVFAQAIHDISPRQHRPMIRVSCAAIPSALIESELFGRERGAFTGALSQQIGRFEAANQSTLFLDEIGELQPEVQVKLLRVLQERVIERLGSTQPIKVDVRIIAASNRDLEKAVNDGIFRGDLFYRLNVFPIVAPPLRERAEDIPGLVWAFIDEFSRLFGKTIESVSKDSLKELRRYAWPGNVRELRNVIERAVILSTGRQLVVPAPKPSGRMLPQAAMTLEALEVEHIRTVLESTNWRVRGAGGAAERLDLKPTTLESRMARLGITRKRTS